MEGGSPSGLTPARGLWTRSWTMSASLIALAPALLGVAGVRGAGASKSGGSITGGISRLRRGKTACRVTGTMVKTWKIKDMKTSKKTRKGSVWLKVIKVLIQLS